MYAIKGYYSLFTSHKEIQKIVDKWENKFKKYLEKQQNDSRWIEGTMY